MTTTDAISALSFHHLHFTVGSGKNMSTSDMYPLGLINGQNLYFATKDAAQQYGVSPQKYWLAPFDKPLPMPDGGRGLPDLRHQVLKCPYSGENITISMQTPRVLHKHGQAVYFCCWGCINHFWTDPASAFAWEGEGPDPRPSPDPDIWK